MKEIRLRPIPEPVREIQELERYLIEVLKKDFYLPLISKVTALHNSSSFKKAISSGSIRYVDNGFKGKFSASLSSELKKLGATWKNGKWEILRSALPSDILLELSEQAKKDSAAISKLVDALKSVKLRVLKPKKILSKTTIAVEKEIKSSFRANVTQISIQPSITKAAKDTIKSDYLENLDLAIKDFTGKEISDLRKHVERHVFSGNRNQELASYIEQSFRVAKRKAKFLARQETNLLSAKLKEIRYKEAGVDDYEWRTVTGTEAHPVRDLHKKLDRTRQKFSQPPITNKNGARNNPGEDYNCRCHAIPILKIG